MKSPIDALVESRKLPPGHIGRKTARARVDSIYAACREVERHWGKKLKKYARRVDWTPERVRALYDYLTDHFGAKQIREINWGVPQNGGAYYRAGTVNFRWMSADLTTIIHELAHHWAPGHGQSFLAREEMLFRETLSFLQKHTKYGIVTF